MFVLSEIQTLQAIQPDNSCLKLTLRFFTQRQDSSILYGHL